MSIETKYKFQQLLRELFQFDLADLDFGLYRIMNHKRQVIERWITENMPDAINKELQQDVLAEQDRAQKALAEASQKVIETLGQDAIDAEGTLAQAYVNTPLGKEYMKARARAAHAQSREALEAAVYNHLYAFFSRYYQDGDFISKRRYAKKERYAIPYNGEEVMLYWAAHDQYYIKTAEHFTDYAWKAPNGVTVRFKLKAADVEQNNLKGEKRFFLPVLSELVWEEASRTLTLPFAYRPLTKQEGIAYSGKNPQEAILEKARPDMLERLKKNAEALAALTAERRKDAQGEPVTYLAHHLRQYAARNSRDFFIHKDLRGFLARELDFYLKNEVLNLEELETAGEALSPGWFQLLRLIKRVGNAIIDFLVQIEDFQKALWEKRKFVTATFYVITVGHIPQDFYEEIADCDKQWDEWQSLLGLDENAQDLFAAGQSQTEKRLALLKSRPSLSLDTRHFPPAFTDRLLASFENLDEATDGLLVHSENWQALNLLGEKYRERVQCVYIDPPYNTGNGDFIYRDNYQHSSWLAMMHNRIQVCAPIMSSESAIFISIGNDECANLRLLIDVVLGQGNFRSSVIYRRGIKSVQAQFETVDRLNQGYDFLLMASKCEKTRFSKLMVPKSPEDDNGDENQKPVGGWNNHWRGTDRPTMRYPLFGTTPLSGQWRWGRERSEIAIENYKKMCIELGNDNPSQEQIDEWIRNKDDAGERLDLLRLSSAGSPEHYIRPSSEKLSSDLWIDLKPNGSHQIEALFRKKLFDNPKSTNLVERIAKFVSDDGNIILDYFAGSGTTGHAVINLNREDGGRRKFMLVEMGEYFDSVLLPRLKKVTFSPEWKDGQPKRPATQEEFARGPRLIKVIRLESYEDALNNIAFAEIGGQQALDLFGGEYFLRYMLKWEARKSETLLDVEKLQTPFSYQLHLHRDGATHAQAVDLAETFNYLLGLDVKTRKVYDNSGRRYLVYRGTTRAGRQAAIFWRETKDWSLSDYEREAAFVAEHQLTDGADEIFVNGDAVIPGAQSLDGLFKARLFGGKEA